jgi:ribulose-5-phosphate 4-epimerase/fuculose-1-phosphate aldolase
MREEQLRQDLVTYGRSLFDRGLTPGRTGNLSARSGSRILITPTGASLGRLEADALAVVDLDGTVLAGPQPSKELPLHLAMYRARADGGAVAHLHSPAAVALSILAEVEAADILPALTPYFVMRVGRLPLLAYARPGSRDLAESLGALPNGTNAALLANHGSIALGANLVDAVEAVEEIEATAHVFLITRGAPIRTLTEAQANELR